MNTDENQFEQKQTKGTRDDKMRGFTRITQIFTNWGIRDGDGARLRFSAIGCFCAKAYETDVFSVEMWNGELRNGFVFLRNSTTDCRNDCDLCAALLPFSTAMIEHKYSTFWPRFCAGFVDGFIFLPIGLLIDLAYSHTTLVPFRILLYVISSSLFLFYSIWMHGKYGQTLGKMACKVIVLDVSERPLKMKQAFLRDILGVVLFPLGLAVDIPRIIHGNDPYDPQTISTVVDIIIQYSTLAWFLLEIITMLTNKKRRALHDFIAGSVVVRKDALAPTLMPTP